MSREVASLHRKAGTISPSAGSGSVPNRLPTFSTDVLDRDLPLDEAGNTSLAFSCRPTSVPDDVRGRLEASDVSNLSVSDTQSFLALPSDAIVGLASDSLGCRDADADSRDRHRRRR